MFNKKDSLRLHSRRLDKCTPCITSPGNKKESFRHLREFPPASLQRPLTPRCFLCACFSGFTHSLRDSPMSCTLAFHLFLLLSSTPLYEWHILFVHFPADGCRMVSTISLLWINMMDIFVHESLCRHVFLFLLNKYPGVALPVPMVSVCSTF